MTKLPIPPKCWKCGAPATQSTFYVDHVDYSSSELGALIVVQSGCADHDPVDAPPRQSICVNSWKTEAYQ